MKRLDPRSGGRGIDISLVGTIKSIKFPAPHTPLGWIRSCADCGQHFIASYRTGTIHSGSENKCAECWLEAMRAIREDV